MALRGRLGVIAAAAVAVAIALACLVAYLTVRSELRSQADEALRSQATRVGLAAPAVLPLPATQLPAPAPRFGGRAGYAVFVSPSGDVLGLQGAPALPVDERVRSVATGQDADFFRDANVGGTHVRVLTAHLPIGGAVQLGRSLESVDSVLGRLRLVLLIVALAGVALAAFLGRELRRAAARAALAESSRAQRELVADASHELRTPVTSLRTNIEVLLEEADLPEEDRRALLRDLRGQTEELGGLIGDLIELSRGDAPGLVLEDVRLDELTAAAVERARRHSPSLEFALESEPVVVRAAPDRLSRALDNLLGNAARHSPPGRPVEVSVDAGGVTVRDRGAGIDDADLPHLFDRFYRGNGSRGHPGSGLGLAIVRQVAEAHGGSVTATNADGGGALFRLDLPATTLNPAPGA
jgi:two-component system sensor histidine kinase MprB